MIYQPKGVCSNTIDVQVEDGVIKSVKFTGDATATCREFQGWLQE